MSANRVRRDLNRLLAVASRGTSDRDAECGPGGALRCTIPKAQGPMTDPAMEME
jgi:hypothetical protein